VIVHRDPHQGTGLDEPLRDTYVLCTRLRVSGRVIVNTDDCGGVRQDRRLENGTGLDDARGKSAGAYRVDTDYDVGGVEKHDAELLLPQITQQGNEDTRNVFG